MSFPRLCYAATMKTHKQNSEQVLSEAEVAEFIGVSRRTLQRLIKTAHFNVVPVQVSPRKKQYLYSEIVGWLREHRAA